MVLAKLRILSEVTELVKKWSLDLALSLSEFKMILKTDMWPSFT